MIFFDYTGNFGGNQLRMWLTFFIFKSLRMIKTGIKRFDFFRTWYYDGAELVGKYKMPKIAATQALPSNVISFTELGTVHNRQNCWVDHFVDDVYFNYAWNNLDKKLPIYKEFAGVIGFDWSLDNEFQPGLNIWHCTKCRNADYYMQQHGVEVIPVAAWLDPESFDWCLDGLPINSSIAVSTNGCLSEKESLKCFIDGVEIVQERLDPSHLIVCGKPVKELDHYSNIFYYPNFSERRNRRCKDGKSW